MKMLIYDENNKLTSEYTDKEYINRMLLYYFINKEVYNLYKCKVNICGDIIFTDKNNNYKIKFRGVDI